MGRVLKWPWRGKWFPDWADWNHRTGYRTNTFLCLVCTSTVRIRSSPPTGIRSPKAISGTNVRNTSIRSLASGVQNRLTTITKEIIHWSPFRSSKATPKASAPRPCNEVGIHRDKKRSSASEADHRSFFVFRFVLELIVWLISSPEFLVSRFIAQNERREGGTGLSIDREQIRTGVVPQNGRPSSIRLAPLSTTLVFPTFRWLWNDRSQVERNTENAVEV